MILQKKGSGLFVAKHPAGCSGKRVLTPFLAAVLLLLAGGCGGDGRVEIGGKVTLDGVPVETGTISFQPADGDGPTAEALISNGRYAVAVALGKKKVAIQGYKVVGQEHVFPDDPTSPLAPKTEPIVPEKYNTQTTLTFDVSEAVDDADSDLQP